MENRNNLAIIITFILLHCCSLSIAQMMFSDPVYLSPDYPEFSDPVFDVEDVNNDGFKDVVIGADGTIILNIRTGNNMEFEQPILINTDENINVDFIFLEDLDNDGDSDILFVDKSENKIAYHENLGGLSFGIEKIISTTGTALHTADVGDLDGDGDVDIVCTYELHEKLVLFRNLNNPGVSFFREVINDNLYQATALEIVDLDQDGNLDILAGSFSRDGFSVYLGPNFSRQIISSNDINSLLSFTVGDLDNDGDNDIILHEDFNTIPSIFLQQTINSWSEWTSATYGGTEYAHLVLDIDNDGQAEVVRGSFSSTNILYFDDDGDLESTVSLSPEHGAATLMIYEDMDNDGLDDLLMNSASGDYIRMFKHLPDDSFQAVSFLVTHKNRGGNCMVYQDFNGDGKEDILYSSRTASEGNPQLTLQFQTTEKFGFLEHVDLGSAQYFLTGDMDGDGLIDVVSLHLDGDLNLHLQNNSLEVFADPMQITSSNLDFRLKPKLVDIDNDGDLDIISVDYDSKEVFLIKNNNGTQFEDPVLVYETSETIRDFQLMDVDNSGSLDLVYCSQSQSSVAVVYDFLGGNPLLISLGSISRASGLSVDDLDQDGFLDIVVYNTVIDNLPLDPSDDVLFLFRSIDGRSFELEVLSSSLGLVTNLEIVDIDMDGDKDILLSDRINGNIIFEQKGDDFDQYDIPSSGEIIGADHVITDLDDDGDFDLMVIGSDGIYVLINIEGNYRQTVVSFFDKNENGLFDENENILRDIEFKIDPSTIYGFSGEDGVYDFFLNQIEYEISYISNEKWTYTIEPVVNVLGGEGLDTIFYGLKPLQEFSELGVDVGGSIPRCSFVNKYWSSVVNDGTLPVNSVFQITIDTLMSLVDIATISPMPDSIVERTIYWSVPTLEPTEQQKFEFYVQLPNEDFFGEQLTIKGRAIAMEPQLDTTEYSLVNILRCAYDPNDKRVVPMGEFDEGFVQLDQELEYTVRFQNTGNDTAFTVLITDQLSNNLDQSTFEFISASHEVVYAINDGREISFLFEDIMLPDSTTNEQESHGFVKFKIKPDKDINENAIVRNRAEIFFDFNQPIITDFTRNTFVSIIPIDIDGDGWFSDLDCNDMNNEVNPGQIEIPYNGIDDDCNPDTYDDDIDQDGYLFDDDCDDNDFASNPGELEIPYDFIDNDCNPLTLDDDLDQDGFFLLDPFDYDCDDDNPNINPGALEIPNNGVDEDCDGLDLISSIHEIANVVINIYPNPASDQVNIAVEGNLNFKASLFDWNGKLFTEIINKYHIRIDHIPAGVYLLEVKDLNSTQKVVERIIIWR